MSALLFIWSLKKVGTLPRSIYELLRSRTFLYDANVKIAEDPNQLGQNERYWHDGSAFSHHRLLRFLHVSRREMRHLPSLKVATLAARRRGQGASAKMP